MRKPMFTQKEFDEQLPNAIRRKTEYLTQDKECTFFCRTCKTTWTARARFAISRGCPKCNRDLAQAKRTKSATEYREQVKRHNPDIKLLDNYAGYYRPLRVKNVRCGHTFTLKSPNVAALRKVRCPGCHDAKKWSKQDFCRLLPETLTLISPFISRANPCTVYCSICDAEYTSIAEKIIHHGCTGCNTRNKGITLRKDSKTYVEEIKSKHPEVEVLDTYTTALGVLRFRNTRCGHEWSCRARQMYVCTSCPVCRKKQVKLGNKTVHVRGYEDRALKYMLTCFTHTKIEVENEGCVPTFSYTFRGSKRRYYPDMYIPRINTIVEVKSTATAGLSGEYFYRAPKEIFYKLRAKAIHVMGAGFKFKLLIMGNSSQPLKIPKNWYELNFQQFKASISPQKGFTIKQ